MLITIITIIIIITTTVFACLILSYACLKYAYAIDFSSVYLSWPYTYIKYHVVLLKKLR